MLAAINLSVRGLPCGPPNRSSAARFRTEHRAAVHCENAHGYAIIASCAGAIDSRGESSLLTSILAASQGRTKNGIPITTLPPLSLSQSFGRIPRNPSGNCRWFAGDSSRHGRKTLLSLLG